MQKFTQKWALICLLEPIKENSEFFWKDFPLHVTLAGVFAIDLNSKQLFDELSQLLSNEKTTVTNAEEETYWGENKEYHVMKLRMTPGVMSLQSTIFDALIKAGAVFNEPQYAGQGYIPHCTMQKHARLNVGDEVTINEVTIVDMFPSSDGYQRKIVKTIKLLK